MKLTFIKDNAEITNDNWEKSWRPKKDNQWKDGRSSKELAKFASSESFPSLISQILKSCGIAEQNFECTPEAKSSLGKGFNRGCRNHDLLMKGDNNCIIGIEAKVSESFDKAWKIILNEQQKKYNDDETKTRAYKLKKNLVKEENHNVDEIGYQLFTATRATINCAIEKGKSQCIVLVIVFEGEIDKGDQYEEKVVKNNKDFVEFCKAVGVQDGKINIDGIECWIKKVSVNLSESYTFLIK